MKSVIRTNERNAENIDKAIESNQKQSEALVKSSETVNLMAKTQNDLQVQYLKEKEKNENLKDTLINKMNKKIKDQQDELDQHEKEKAGIEARAAELESQVVGLKSLYDMSEGNMKALKQKMIEMKQDNERSEEDLAEDLRRTDVALLIQTCLLYTSDAADE